MLGNAIKQTTATTGTGNLTLASVTGYPTLSQVFSLNTPFSYTLLDSNGLFLEAGIGYLPDASTLVRARVMATYSGGTYTKESPAALSLTGTTTVICTPHAGTSQIPMPQLDNVSTSMDRYVTPANAIQASVSAPMNLTRCTYMPFHLRMGILLTGFRLQVSSAGGAGATIKVGLYAVATSGMVGQQLAVGSADIDASSTGVKSVSCTPLFLPAGDYFTATVAYCTTTAPSVYNLNGPGTILGGNSLGVQLGTINPIAGRYESLTSGAALPATPGATAGNNAGNITMPYVLLGAG